MQSFVPPFLFLAMLMGVDAKQDEDDSTEASQHDENWPILPKQRHKGAKI
jgi:hypothetical protein